MAQTTSPRRPGRAGHEPGHWERIASVYEDGGRYPTKAVANHFGWTARQASGKVAQARLRGFIPPTTKGRTSNNGFRKVERLAVELGISVETLTAALRQVHAEIF